jgi:four helix bundle protein
VYNLLCDLHIEIWEETKRWPQSERFELTSQVLRSSNSSPAQLAEKNEDRHVKNRVEGVNRARGEASETIHHLRIAKRKGYIDEAAFDQYRERYQECIRMLNGLEKNLESSLPEKDRKWVRESRESYSADIPPGYPDHSPL